MSIITLNVNDLNTPIKDRDCQGTSINKIQLGGSHPAQQADEEQAQNQVPHAGCMALGRQRVGGEGAVSPTKIDRPRGWGVEIRGKEHPAKDVEH